MSTKLILIGAVLVALVAVWLTSKGIQRVFLIIGTLSVFIIGILFWTERLSFSELMQDLGGLVNG